ncbi:type IV pilus assembly protein FimV [Methylomonas rosea]|uniref:Uncharacterized protein n=1 Tax=Methylomonas rosea TaxID=2952227 RepID=A0ABT1TMA4_9GAMM|nr:hypothetical protein [Methylomonas sp. WSC-7]MCQ8115867.1 hypothetical protein [Methylomonas sp. WSC-7]
MPQYFSRLLAGPSSDERLQETDFWHDRELSLFSCPNDDAGQALTAIVFKISRNPKDLLTHLRRIYFCYDRRLSEQLYAALLDLVIVLDGKGNSISRRMIQASQSQLHGQQYQDLLKTKGPEPVGNRYSLFSKGMLGRRELVRSIQQTETQHDYLALANDFIEYSQLEQAMDVLETGINFHHDRPDLQMALLELYKSTKNRERFQINRQRFSDSGIVLDGEWLELANYFEGQAS